MTQALVSAVLALLLSFLFPVFVNRRAFNSAVRKYVDNPSPSNRASMERERSENERVALETHIETAAVLFVLINLGWFLVARRSRKTSPGQG